MLDACNQVGWKLHEAHQEVKTEPSHAFISDKLRTVCIQQSSEYTYVLGLIGEKKDGYQSCNLLNYLTAA